MGFLKDCLEQAVRMGAERIEIEYRDGREDITAFRGAVGVGVGSIESSQARRCSRS